MIRKTEYKGLEAKILLPMQSLNSFHTRDTTRIANSDLVVDIHVIQASTALSSHLHSIGLTVDLIVSFNFTS